MSADLLGMPSETFNSDAPSVYLRVQYCGGWGYRPRVMALKALVDKKDYAGKITYYLYKDPGTTGNLEVTAFETADMAGDGMQIYSKKASGKFPHDDADTFFGMLESECENMLKWSHLRLILGPYHEIERLYILTVVWDNEKLTDKSEKSGLISIIPKLETL